jgi:hypothetical protein
MTPEPTRARAICTFAPLPLEPHEAVMERALAAIERYERRADAAQSRPESEHDADAG